MLKNQQIQLKKQIDAELKALSELGQVIFIKKTNVLILF